MRKAGGNNEIMSKNKSGQKIGETEGSRIETNSEYHENRGRNI
jgi:hypothetical protein